MTFDKILFGSLHVIGILLILIGMFTADLDKQHHGISLLTLSYVSDLYSKANP